MEAESASPPLVTHRVKKLSSFEYILLALSRNFLLDGFNVKDKTNQPMNIKFKDLYAPTTEVNILEGKDTPLDLKNLPLIEPNHKKVEGVVIDIVDFYQYKSCPGHEGSCRKKYDPNMTVQSCGHASKPEDTLKVNLSFNYHILLNQLGNFCI